MERLLVFGLGNPGRQYEATRHNLGFRVADDLASFCRIPLQDGSRYAVYGEGQWKSHSLVLAKPLTYMNRSGLAVAELLERFGQSPGDVLVVSDDVSLPLGELRVRPRGSSGGQKGLQSIIEQLGTEEFGRLRLGIGPAPPGTPLEDFVLEAFLPNEEQVAQEMIWKAREATLCVLEAGMEQTMRLFNRRARSCTEVQNQDQEPAHQRVQAQDEG